MYAIFSSVILIGLELLHFIVIVVWLRSVLNAKHQSFWETDDCCGLILDTLRVTDFHYMHLGSPE